MVKDAYPVGEIGRVVDTVGEQRFIGLDARLGNKSQANDYKKK